jgi:hypothetical protein
MPFAQISPTDKNHRHQNEIWVLVASPMESMSATHPLRPNAARLLTFTSAPYALLDGPKLMLG